MNVTEAITTSIKPSEAYLSLSLVIFILLMFWFKIIEDRKKEIKNDAYLIKRLKK